MRLGHAQQIVRLICVTTCLCALLCLETARAQTPDPYLDLWAPISLDGQEWDIRPLPPPLEEVSPGESSPRQADTDKQMTDELIVIEGEPPPKVWSSTFEMGLSGSEGNTQSFNLRFGWDLKREIPGETFTLETDYKKDQTDSLETANRLFVDGRQEWDFPESPWSVFVHITSEYDEFKPFDVRLSEDAGVGYQFWKSKISSFRSRFGAGISREINGPDDDVKHEATFGMNYQRRLTEQQKVVTSVDYFPQWRDFGDSRITTKAEWEVLLDNPSNLSFKVGVIDRYDSSPNGAKHNDFDYSFTLLWKL